MNCQEYQEWVQRRLDGEAASDDAVEQHRAGCPACAGLHDAVGRLDAGLRLLAAPVAPPKELADSIVHRVLYERRAVRRRLVAYAAAMAACLVLGLYLGKLQRDEPAVVVAPEIQPTVVEKPAEPPKLNEQVGEAGTAVAALVSRTADEAVGQGRLLLPEPMPPMPTVVDPWGETLEPPAQSLYDAGQGVSAGLEPVASSARRAVTLFLHDIPPMTQGLQ